MIEIIIVALAALGLIVILIAGFLPMELPLLVVLGVTVIIILAVLVVGNDEEEVG